MLALASAVADTVVVAVRDADAPGAAEVVGVSDAVAGADADSEPDAVGDAEEPKVALAVGVDDGVAAALADTVGTAVCDGDAPSVTEPVAVSVCVAAAVLEGEAVIGLGDGDGEPDADTDGERDALPLVDADGATLRVSDADGEPLAATDADCEPLAVRDGGSEALTSTVSDGVTLLELAEVADRVGDTVEDAAAVVDLDAYAGTHPGAEKRRQLASHKRRPRLTLCCQTHLYILAGASGCSWGCGGWQNAMRRGVEEQALWRGGGRAGGGTHDGLRVVEKCAVDVS